MITLDEILSVDFLKILIPLAGAVGAWLVNEWRRRLAEQHARKEERYSHLLRGMRGFYLGDDNGTLTDQDAEEVHELRTRFLEEVNVCWLYCPDDVIKKAYDFLETVRSDVNSTDTERSTAAGALIAAIRRDSLKRRLVQRTKLTGKEFKHMAAFRQKTAARVGSSVGGE